jgi:hypothetical protein
MKRLFIIMLSLVWFNGINLFSQNISSTMSYQGKLSDINGNPLNTNVSVRFSIYAQSAGGAALWQETHPQVTVTNGIFNVLLGSVTPFTNGLFGNPSLFLGINVASDGEMSPRSPISSVPFAQATSAWKINGSNIFHNTGNVGIGTDNPAHKLTVDGTIKGMNNSLFAVGVLGEGNIAGVMGTAIGSGLYGKGGIYGLLAEADVANYPNAVAARFIGKVGIGKLPLTDFDLEGNAHISGNVGIGTANPTSRLTVAGTVKATNNAFLATALIGEGNVIGVMGTAISTGIFGKGGTYGIWAQADVQNYPNAIAARFDGNVKVMGKTETNILEITGGSDLSETFDVSEEDSVIEGMLLTIDPANQGKLKVAETAYDKTVAGIVSGAGGINTGMRMGQKGSIADGSVAVALTGRVFCLASTENGAIQPGDLLTTSSMKGHAMKVNDHQRAQGAIIGKAMTSLDAGEGLVLVLVSLQ